MAGRSRFPTSWSAPDPAFITMIAGVTFVLNGLYDTDRDWGYDQTHALSEGGRTGSLIEILVLQALAHQALADLPAALDSLERALTLAEPEGYVRIFVNEGEAMRDLLRHATAGGIAGSYSRRLLAAFGEPAQPDSIPTRAAAAGLAQPLTAREGEILRLIAAGMRNQEIADHPFISLSTVKRHIANGYGKLDVSHRTEAVARANELDLL